MNGVCLKGYDRYFCWLVSLVNGADINDALLETLFEHTFWSPDSLDENRIADGLALRRGYPFVPPNPPDSSYCSVLEMMVALALRWERSMMADPELGDRTGLWFAKMCENMGFRPYSQDFDPEKASEILDRLCKRSYRPDGKGGLFYIPNCREDLRNLEIWYQMMLYLEMEES